MAGLRDIALVLLLLGCQPGAPAPPTPAADAGARLAQQFGLQQVVVGLDPELGRGEIALLVADDAFWATAEPLAQARAESLAVALWRQLQPPPRSATGVVLFLTNAAGLSTLHAPTRYWWFTAEQLQQNR